MNLNSVLEWEMHSPCGDVRFHAAREGHGYSVVVEKDGAMALTAMAPDGVTLLRRSHDLRAALQGLGYAPARASYVSGEVLRRSIEPLPPSLVSILRD
jgi:hypothetical protein